MRTLRLNNQKPFICCGSRPWASGFHPRVLFTEHYWLKGSNSACLNPRLGSSTCRLYIDHEKEVLKNFKVKMKGYPLGVRSQNQHLLYHKMDIKIHIKERKELPAQKHLTNLNEGITVPKGIIYKEMRVIHQQKI